MLATVTIQTGTRGAAVVISELDKDGTTRSRTERIPPAMVRFVTSERATGFLITEDEEGVEYPAPANPVDEVAAANAASDPL